jgi:hypothetical protein
MSIQQGEQKIDKKNNLRILFYQREDKRLQEEQNKLLVKNNRWAFWAMVFGFLAFMAQTVQIITDILLVKFVK